MGRVLVTGAGNQIGFFLLPRLLRAGYSVLAMARRRPDWVQADPKLDWRCVDLRQTRRVDEALDAVVHMAPLGMLGNLVLTGARVVIAVSSTSIDVKRDSRDAAERRVAAELQRGEARVREWAQRNGAVATIVRPTLIYGCGRDANITRLAAWIRRWPVFPCLGRASGRRQPVHGDDLAQALQRLLELPRAPTLLTLPGGEVLAYRDLLARIARAMDRPLRCVSLPGWMWRLVLAIAHRAGYWNDVHLAMLQRMNDDLVFPLDDWALTGVKPRSFNPHFPAGELDDRAS